VDTVARRSVTATYMKPDASQDKRRSWYARWATLTASSLVFPVCGQKWSVRCGHLHQLSYQRLGAGDVGELTP
jgi:hypothetical protein